ncbi:MAG: methionyl-tRNA formyltransferase [Treponema sp.]|jgi:methionyl-tRNA formyltransferase|nr:methionyl-tRNA formyltransferase [Treponema sp.]
MRILFAGSPEIAVPTLKTLIKLSEDGICELAGALTTPDAPPSGRAPPEPSAVGRAALTEGAGGRPPVVLKPEKLDAPAREAVRALKPDLLVSFAYGKIFGPKFLAIFPQGGINIHPSLLPKYRGPSPIQAAILGRDAETGISVQRLTAEVDAGDILAQATIPLLGRETAPVLSGIAAQGGAALLAEIIPRLQEDPSLPGRPQDHDQATYCSLITREDGRIDWNRAAEEIDARIRAFDPWPLCYTRHGDRELYILAGRPYEGSSGGISGKGEPAEFSPGTVLGIDKDAGILIQTGNGIFAVIRLQYRAGKALDWRAFLNGARNFIGVWLE